MNQAINVTFNNVNANSIDAANIVLQASPVESPNGSRVTFTLPNSDSYRSGMIKVYRDGILINGITEASSTTVTLPSAPDSDETITMDYIKQ